MNGFCARAAVATQERTAIKQTLTEWGFMGIFLFEAEIPELQGEWVESGKHCRLRSGDGKSGAGQAPIFFDLGFRMSLILFVFRKWHSELSN